MELTFKDKKPFLFKYFPGLTFSVIQKKKGIFKVFTIFLRCLMKWIILFLKVF